MQEVTLNNGVKMPIIGFGVFQMPEEKEAEKAVSEALEVGYRSIDTASAYFNEAAVGNAIKNSGIKREDLFITTKVWIQDAGYENTLKAFDTSLKKLQLDYLDLYLIHKPYSDYYGSWKAMEKLYKEGYIKSIGVTSFWNERLADLFSFNEIKPAVNQIETNVWNQQWEAEKFMKEHGIQHEAWAPFAEGKGDVFQNPLLKEIAEKHQKSVGQIMLRFFVQRNIVVIPKTAHKERMKENIDVFDFVLSEEEMEQIGTLDKKKSIIYNEMNPKHALRYKNSKIHD